MEPRDEGKRNQHHFGDPCEAVKRVAHRSPSKTHKQHEDQQQPRKDAGKKKTRSPLKWDGFNNCWPPCARQRSGHTGELHLGVG
jgi:hypothetical protein